MCSPILLNSQEFPNLKPTALFGKISFEAIKDIDVLIDFSNPAAFSKWQPMLRELRKPAVIGTTGFSPKEEETIKTLSKVVPIVFTPNMSIGVNVLFQLVQKSAKLLPNDFTAHIEEIHHSQKRDAPSGTAKWLQKEIKNFRHEAPTESIRGGDVVGEHTVKFIGFGERIELVHRATSRDIFARGALRAAEWITNQKPGLYTMQDVLDPPKE